MSAFVGVKRVLVGPADMAHYVSLPAAHPTTNHKPPPELRFLRLISMVLTPLQVQSFISESISHKLHD